MRSLFTRHEGPRLPSKVIARHPELVEDLGSNSFADVRPVCAEPGPDGAGPRSPRPSPRRPTESRKRPPGGGGASGTGSTAPWGGDATCPVLRANRSFWHPSRPRGSSPAGLLTSTASVASRASRWPAGISVGRVPARLPQRRYAARMFAEIPFISRQPSFHPSHSSPCLVPLPGGRRGKPLQVLGWRDSRRPNQFLILVAGGDPTGVASTRFRRATR